MAAKNLNVIDVYTFQFFTTIERSITHFLEFFGECDVSQFLTLIKGTTLK